MFSAWRLQDELADRKFVGPCWWLNSSTSGYATHTATVPPRSVRRAVRSSFGWRLQSSSPAVSLKSFVLSVLRCHRTQSLSLFFSIAVSLSRTHTLSHSVVLSFSASPPRLQPLHHPHPKNNDANLIFPVLFGFFVIFSCFILLFFSLLFHSGSKAANVFSRPRAQTFSGHPTRRPPAEVSTHYLGHKTLNRLLVGLGPFWPGAYGWLAEFGFGGEKEKKKTLRRLSVLF